MKKSLLLLGLLLMSGSNIVKAEKQTITVEIYGDYNWTYDYTPTGYAYDVDITCEDGVFTIDDFMKSGTPLSFTIGRGISANSQTFINFIGDVKNEYANYGGINSYILKPGSEEGIIGKIWTDDANGEKEVDDPYIFNACDETFARLTDNVNGNYEVTMKLYAVTNHMQFPNDPTIYNTERSYRLKFYINAPEPESTPITVELWNETGTQKSTNLPYETVLNIDKENGIYTIANFLDSTQPMSFSFDPNDESVNIPIKLEDNVMTKEIGGLEYNYITQLDADPDSEYAYLSHAVFHTQGEVRPTNISRPYITLSKSYVTPVDKEANNGNNYMANIYVSASGNSFDRNLRFYFSGPEKGATGITEITNDNENAPVEYYNLNGQRVNNPANGVFVRKQGSKVEKIVIR